MYSSIINNTPKWGRGRPFSHTFCVLVCVCASDIV